MTWEEPVKFIARIMTDAGFLNHCADDRQRTLQRMTGRNQ